MVPADTPFYMEAVVRPEGQLGDDLDSALSKLLVTDDVGGKIQDAIDDGLASEGEDLTYEADIAPWLGSRAGVYFNGYDAKTNEAEGAAVVAVTDADAAQSFVDKVAAEGEGKAEQQDYNGVQLTVSPDDTALGDRRRLPARRHHPGRRGRDRREGRRQLRRGRRLDDRPRRRSPTTASSRSTPTRRRRST